MRHDQKDFHLSFALSHQVRYLKHHLAGHVNSGRATALRLKWAYPYNNGNGTGENAIIGDGQDVALISVFVVDSQNRVVPNANNTVTFTLDNESIAFILGVGNGNPGSGAERDKSNFRSVYHGKARVLIQSKLNKEGKVKLTATAKGLESDSITFNINKPPQQIRFV